MNSESATHTAIRALFANHCGRDKPITYHELADLSGAAAARVYAYANGEHLGSAAALVHLCRQVPEAAAALHALIDHDAQQSHGDEFELLSEFRQGDRRDGRARRQGAASAIARATAINVARRLKTRCALYLAFHAQRAA